MKLGDNFTVTGQVFDRLHKQVRCLLPARWPWVLIPYVRYQKLIFCTEMYDGQRDKWFQHWTQSHFKHYHIHCKHGTSKAAHFPMKSCLACAFRQHLEHTGYHTCTHRFSEVKSCIQPFLKSEIVVIIRPLTCLDCWSRILDTLVCSSWPSDAASMWPQTYDTSVQAS